MDKEPSSNNGIEPENPALDAIPAPSGESTLIDTDYVIGQDNMGIRI